MLQEDNKQALMTMIPHPTPLSPLLTDLYQLTMAQGYWLSGRAEHEAVFHLHFRKNPFAGGYAIACGLADALAFIEGHRFTEDDLAYLAQIPGDDGKPIFAQAFLAYLAQLKLTVDVDAIAEGTVVFANEPLVRVRGPILQAQLLETTLLNLVNFQTLIATKAARVVQAAQGDPVIEFGLRRAQGVDGAMSASRASFIGGCSATSNVLAGKAYGIPVRGTHAHSWVMSFDDELTAFEIYAEAMPNNAVFLVDTYDTLKGVDHAIIVGRKLAAKGYRMGGIRLDSGDLAWLSVQARKKLDAAGFTDAAIVASNDLDEHLIESLKQQGAAINVWGVGTKLATSYDQPALGGVYKLGAIRAHAGEAWRPCVKLSEQTIKVSVPGIQQVRRFRSANDGHLVADMIFDELQPPTNHAAIVDPADPTRLRPIGENVVHEDLLTPVIRAGLAVGPRPSATEAKQRTTQQLAALPSTIKRFAHPHEYPVGLEPQLAANRLELIRAARANTKAAL